MKPVLEICCSDIDSVNAAVEGGADRIELCSALAEGGLTPSAGLLRQAILCGKPVNVLIRPRGGDFLYSQKEVDVMLEDIRLAADSGANGIVIGALDHDGDVDTNVLKRLIDEAAGLKVTFHRAFDLCSNPQKALEQIILLGCDTLLTSGLSSSALSGGERIKKLKLQAGGRIEIMAGCGIRPDNLESVIRITEADAIHGSASHSIKSDMKFKRNDVSMGKNDCEYIRLSTDKKQVRQMRDIIENIF